MQLFKNMQKQKAATERKVPVVSPSIGASVGRWTNNLLTNYGTQSDETIAHI